LLWLQLTCRPVWKTRETKATSGPLPPTECGNNATDARSQIMLTATINIVCEDSDRADSLQFQADEAHLFPTGAIQEC
jgi:hypothetical protein